MYIRFLRSVLEELIWTSILQLGKYGWSCVTHELYVIPDVAARCPLSRRRSGLHSMNVCLGQRTHVREENMHILYTKSIVIWFACDAYVTPMVRRTVNGLVLLSLLGWISAKNSFSLETLFTLLINPGLIFSPVNTTTRNLPHKRVEYKNSVSTFPGCNWQWNNVNWNCFNWRWRHPSQHGALCIRRF